jgi:hypothetical protein
MNWYDLYNYINPNNLKGIEYSSIPNYSITNVPIMTYALLGITTFALGYITLKDGEKEKGSGSGSESSPPSKSQPDSKPQSQKGGLSEKQKNSKSKTTKKRSK